MPGFILLFIAGGRLFNSLLRVALPLWQRSGRERGTNGRARSVRHHRHVAGRAARRKAGGRRAATRRFDFSVMPKPQRRPIKPISGRPPAGGGQHEAAGGCEADTAAARTEEGEAARGVTGAEHLARRLPSPAGERPFSLLRGVGLMRWG
jgi:hypothetical protein